MSALGLELDGARVLPIWALDQKRVAQILADGSIGGGDMADLLRLFILGDYLPASTLYFPIGLGPHLKSRKNIYMQSDRIGALLGPQLFDALRAPGLGLFYPKAQDMWGSNVLLSLSAGDSEPLLLISDHFHVSGAFSKSAGFEPVM